LDRLVARARRRLRLARVLELAGPVATIAASVALAWLLAARLVLLPRIDGWVLTGAGLLAGVALLAVALRRIPDGWAARAADSWLGSKDRFATAVELRSLAGEGGLVGRQVTEAEDAAARIHRLPGHLRPPRRWLAIGAGCVLAAGLLAAAPDPHAAEREQRAREEAAVEDVADAVEQAAGELRELGEAGEAAADRLERLAERLDEVALEQALEELAATRGELARALDPDRRGQRAALDGLARELGREPLADGDSVRAQLDALADALTAGEVEDPEGLAERLEELSEAIAGGQPEVASALSDAASALAGGDASAAAGAVSSASGAVGSAVAAAGTQSALEAADGVVSDAQRALRDAAAGQGGEGQGGGQGQGAGPGQGQGEGGGQDQGQGEGGAGEGGAGSGGAGEGAGSGQGAGNGGQGGSGGQGGGGQGAGSGQGGRGIDPGQGGTGSGRVGDNDGTAAPGDGPELDTVFAPPGAGGPSDDWQLPGRDTGVGPDAQVGRGFGPGERTRALVPYLDVLGTYRDAATRTIERPGFPAGRRDLVRDYFDQLAR
jgi:hypothetical protein